MKTLRSFASKSALLVSLLALFLVPGRAQDGFIPLFNGRNLDGWTGLNGNTTSYYVKDGVLICREDGKNFLYSEKQYANFVLRFEVKLDRGGNNGIGIRAPMNRRPHVEGMEIQIIDDPFYVRGIPKPNKKPEEWTKVESYQSYGSIYGVVPAKPGHLKPAGEWNVQEILCDGRRVKITLNGAVIVDANLDQVKPLDKLDHPGLQNKAGHIILFAHGDYGAKVYFRNMIIKELP